MPGVSRASDRTVTASGTGPTQLQQSSHRRVRVCPSPPTSTAPVKLSRRRNGDDLQPIDRRGLVRKRFSHSGLAAPTGTVCGPFPRRYSVARTELDLKSLSLPGALEKDVETR
jgi:hypothetical protein